VCVYMTEMKCLDVWECVGKSISWSSVLCERDRVECVFVCVCGLGQSVEDSRAPLLLNKG